MKEHGVTTLKLPFLLYRARQELNKQIRSIKPVRGMVQTLKAIKGSGFVVGMATSNSKENVNIFLDQNRLDDVFDFIYTGNHILGKDRVLKRLMRKRNISKGSALYIGDEVRDIEAAHKAGIPVIAVTWGYNSKKILRAFHPDSLVDQPRKLLAHIQRL